MMTKRPIVHELGLNDHDLELAGRFASFVNRRIFVWGSRVKGYYEDSSDYDISVSGTRHDFPRIRLLAAAFAKNEGIKIDIGLFAEDPQIYGQFVNPSAVLAGRGEL